MTVAFVDLDRTLIDVNSGRLWMRHEWAAGHLGWVDAALASWWLFRYALGDDDLVHALDRAASVYAGQDEATLAARIDAWFDADVAPRARPGALAAIDAHRAAGDRVVLATSSSQFAAARARATWRLDDAISTRIEVRDGVVTGAVAQYGFGRHKLDACAAWASARGVNLAECAFYTDSYSDLTLLEAVGRPVVVHPDRRLARVAHARGWPVLDWGVSAMESPR